MVDRRRGVAQRRRTVKQAFIVSPARSGSTLLRVLLDTHPQIVSPPELNLSALLQHTTASWNNTMVALGEKPPGDAPGADALSDEVVRRARKPVDEIMVACANAAGASLYCDKSLTTIDHLATVTRCYPNAPLVFLYRYPLDFIASGLEASRWGFNAFGFVPYVSTNPGNFVGALANYWIDKVSRMVEFERDFEGSNARIYYELLCDSHVTRSIACSSSSRSIPIIRSSSGRFTVSTAVARVTTRSSTRARSRSSRSVAARRCQNI